RRRREAVHRPLKTQLPTFDKQAGASRQIDLDRDGLPIVLRGRAGRNEARNKAHCQNQVAPHGNTLAKEMVMLQHNIRRSRKELCDSITYGLLNMPIWFSAVRTNSSVKKMPPRTSATR